VIITAKNPFTKGIMTHFDTNTRTIVHEMVEENLHTVRHDHQIGDRLGDRWPSPHSWEEWMLTVKRFNLFADFEVDKGL
jgi:hypothetical protein